MFEKEELAGMKTLIAGFAMQGLITRERPADPHNAAEQSVEYTEALFAELERKGILSNDTE